MIGIKKTFGPGYGKIFQFIGMPAAGMEAVSRKTFSGLEVKDRTLCFQNRIRCMIFSGNQVQRVFNSRFFIPDNFGNLRIIFHQILHNLQETII